MSPETGRGTGKADELVARLRAARKTHASSAARTRRAAVLDALRESTAGLSPEEKVRLADDLRKTLGPRTGGDGSAAGSMEDEVDRLREEAAAVRASAVTARADAAAARKEAAEFKADRDALLRENARLRAGSAGGAAAAGEGSVLEAFRKGLQETLRDKKVTPESLRLPPSEARLFRLMQDLTAFLCNMEQARIRLLSEVDVGPAGGMNTMILSKYRQRVRKEIQAVLDDEQGSVQKLRKTLDSLNRFLYGLNEAYQASYPQGIRGLLSQLDPEPMAAKSRAKLLGTDWESAWQLFVRTRSDLGNLTPAELWDNFFKTPFKNKLDEWIVEPTE